MGFEVNCTSCAARFNLSGELYERKVKGRVVTVRCKKCSASISVDARDRKSGHPQELPDAESWEAVETPRRPPVADGNLEMSPTLPMPGTVSEDLWLVSYGDNDDREMNLLQVRQALRAGEIDAKTLAWREGMKEWLPLEKLPPLAKLVSKAASKPPVPEKKVTTLLGIAPRAESDAAPPSEPSPSSEEPTPLSVEPAPLSEEPTPLSEEPTPLSVEPTPLSEAPAPAPPPAAPRPPPPRAVLGAVKLVRTAVPAQPVQATPSGAETTGAKPAPVKEPPRRGPRALSPGLLGFGPVQPQTVSLGPQAAAPAPSPPTATSTPLPTGAKPASATSTPLPTGAKPASATSTPLPTGAKTLPKPPAAKTLPAGMAAQRAAAAAKPAAPSKSETKPKPASREHPKPPARAKPMAQAASASDNAGDDQVASLEAAAAQLDVGSVVEAASAQLPSNAESDVGVTTPSPVISPEASAAAQASADASTPIAGALDEAWAPPQDAAEVRAVDQEAATPPVAAPAFEAPPPVAELSPPMATAELVPPTTQVATVPAAPARVERIRGPSAARGRFVAGLIAIALAAFGATWLALRPPSETAPAVVEQVPEPAPPRVESPAPPSVAAQVPNPATPPSEPTPSEPAPAEPEPRSAPEKPAAAAVTEPRPERPAATPAREPPAEPARAVAVKATEKTKPSEPAKPPEPKTGDAPFDKAAALAALSSAAGAASSCRKDGDPSGMATVVITFAPSGRVTSANINGPPFAGTPTGGCIASIMRRAKVPAFSGTHTTVSRTVVIQ